MAKFTDLNWKGDSPVLEWEASDPASVETARGYFDEARANGCALLTPVLGGAQVLSEFDPEVEEIIILRQAAGG